MQETLIIKVTDLFLDNRGVDSLLEKAGMKGSFSV
jgi:hypothetical protein